MRAALAEVDAGVAAVPLAPAAGEVAVSAVPAGRIPARLEQAWRELAADAAEPNSYAEIWFAGPSLRHLAGDVEVTLIEAWLHGPGEPLLIGLIPVCVGTGYGRMTVRHVQNWKHFHHFLGTPLVRKGYEQRFWAAVLSHLDAARRAPGFLHVNGLVEDGPVHAGLRAAAAAAGKPLPTVHREVRAALASTLSPAAYYERNVRKKKRKELQRLTNRLAELGQVETRRLGEAGELGPWCDAFLALERAGWKGRAGSALADRPETEAFFRDVVRGAFEAGKLDFLRIDLDGQPIAMLINFLAPPGSFSFKIAFDEAYARFSPGVLIQRENLDILSRVEIAWMDSCAAENHSMIDSLWGERRAIVRVTVPLKGFRRRLTYAVCRGLEHAGALRRRLLHG
jgi:CelD/BcsL family acetyltransferase involved in cellulose biosynthesis